MAKAKEISAATFTATIPKIVIVPIGNDLNQNYVDAWQPAITAADVRVQFGTTVSGNQDEITARLVTTLMFTHAGLLKFAAEIAKVAALLEDVYDGSPPSLDRKSPEQMAEMVKRHFA